MLLLVMLCELRWWVCAWSEQEEAGYSSEQEGRERAASKTGGLECVASKRRGGWARVASKRGEQE